MTDPKMTPAKLAVWHRAIFVKANIGPEIRENVASVFGLII
jgi:hypothetical protein